MRLAIEKDKVTLTVNNPDAGVATEDLAAEYRDDSMEIGFNARYLLDVAQQIEGEEAVFELADSGSPTLVRDEADDNGALRADAAAGCNAALPLRLTPHAYGLPQPRRARSRSSTRGRSACSAPTAPARPTSSKR